MCVGTRSCVCALVREGGREAGRHGGMEAWRHGGGREGCAGVVVTVRTSQKRGADSSDGRDDPFQIMAVQDSLS